MLDDTLTAQIKTATMFVALLSIESQWVQKELAFALTVAQERQAEGYKVVSVNPIPNGAKGRWPLSSSSRARH